MCVTEVGRKVQAHTHTHTHTHTKQLGSQMNPSFHFHKQTTVSPHWWKITCAKKQSYFLLKYDSISTVVPHHLLSSARQLASKSDLAIKRLHLLMYIIIVFGVIRFPHFLLYYFRLPPRSAKAKSHLSSGEKEHREALKRNFSRLIQSSAELMWTRLPESRPAAHWWI